jgi:hypothetical protein
MSTILQELHQLMTDFLRHNEECDVYDAFLDGDMNFVYFLIGATDFVLQKYGMKQTAFPFSEYIFGAETYTKFDTICDEWRASLPSEEEMPDLMVDEYLERLCQVFPELLVEASPITQEVLVFCAQPSNFKSGLVFDLLKCDRCWDFEYFKSGAYLYFYYAPQDESIAQNIDRTSIMNAFLGETSYNECRMDDLWAIGDSTSLQPFLRDIGMYNFFAPDKPTLRADADREMATQTSHKLMEAMKGYEFFCSYNTLDIEYVIRNPATYSLYIDLHAVYCNENYLLFVGVGENELVFIDRWWRMWGE